MATVILMLVRLSSLVTTGEVVITKNSAGKPGLECLCVLVWRVWTRILSHICMNLFACVSVLDNHLHKAKLHWAVKHNRYYFLVITLLLWNVLLVISRDVMLVMMCTMSTFQGDGQRWHCIHHSFHNNCCFSLKISSKTKYFL